ncbi:MAG: HAD hydrolase-like protein [Thermoplasmata archaeon]|nr:HAD hydrolase-like protein [Thermoplasmata archaeon]
MANQAPEERSELPMAGPDREVPLTMAGSATSQFAEISRGVIADQGPVAARTIERGAVVFDVDGTLLDDMATISEVAAKVLFEAFGTPETEGRLHYLATTGMPFEAQVSQLYGAAPLELRRSVAQQFHQRKISEAYARAKPFPEIPKLLKRLAAAKWTLAVSTGAEREMADLVLEREGLRYWFEDVLGSGQGTKREHLAEYRRRYSGAPIVLVGDSRFDLEAAQSVEGVIAVARASSFANWNLSPDDLRRWGAKWADYSLTGLPEALEQIFAPGKKSAVGPKPEARAASRPRKGR